MQRMNIMKTSRKILIIVFILSALLLSGCATSYKRNPLPEAYGDIAQIPYIPYARFWGDKVPSWLQEKIDDIKEEIRQSESDTKYISSDYLAISGGGANGAFGAGMLVGWTTQVAGRNLESCQALVLGRSLHHSLFLVRGMMRN
jgi:hypothetical protein